LPAARDPGAAVSGDLGEITLVIAGVDLGDTIYLGYTANHAAYVTMVRRSGPRLLRPKPPK